MAKKPAVPMNEAAATLGRKGGKARWKGTTKAERSRLMRQAVQARWAKAKGT